MNDRQAYEMKIEELKKIGSDDIVPLHHIPADVFAQEADALYHWAKEDEEILRKIDIDWALVEDLPMRAGALREAQALWYMRKNTPQKIQKEWRVFFPAVKKFKQELVESYRYAFRNKPILLQLIKENTKKNAASYIIQSLRSLRDIGRKNVDLLEKIGFDMAQFDQLEAIIAKAKKLSPAAAAYRWGPVEEKEIRDQAYTYLKEAVDTVRECGKFAFRKDPERLVGYRSEYMHKRNLKLRAKKSSKNKKSAN